MGDAVGREKERGEGVLRDQRKKQWVVGLPRESAVQKIDRWERKVTVNCKLSIARGEAGRSSSLVQLRWSMVRARTKDNTCALQHE